jgi:hypothetical protein
MREDVRGTWDGMQEVTANFAKKTGSDAEGRNSQNGKKDGYY